jgi:type I restriction enzyme M protein
MVPVSEIANAANDYNLNIPRYIDSSEPEDLHDLDAHLRGGIPNRDIDDLRGYWEVFPSLRKALFKKSERAGYSEARVEPQQVKPTILAHDEFAAYRERVTTIFNAWRQAHTPRLNKLKVNDLPRQLIHELSEDLLVRFADLPLLSGTTSING